MIEKQANYSVGIPLLILLVFIWSGWLVATRAGALSALTIFDIAALRFGIGGILALPIYCRRLPGPSRKDCL